MKQTLFSVTFAFIIVLCFGKNSQSTAAGAVSAPLGFIENKGQVTDQYHKPRPDVQFVVKAAPGLNIFIGPGSISYQFSSSNGPASGSKKQIVPGAGFIPDKSSQTLYRMDVALQHANKNARIITNRKLNYYENYFTDLTGPKGVQCSAFCQITYKNIYPDIDWVLYIRNGTLEHEFVVHPGGNVSLIQLKYGGPTGLTLNQNGSLTAVSPLGEITEQAPVCYQNDGSKVTSAYNLKDNLLSYKIGTYEGTLVIDPQLVWGTYLGGTGNDGATDIKQDALHYLYVSGSTQSANGIATVGAYQTTLNAIAASGFLAKLDTNGVVLWATYYGGENDQWINSIALDDSVNIYATGFSSSYSGIATPGAFQTVNHGDNAFLAKFSSSGMLTWGTYFGGYNVETGYGVCTDHAGNVYFTGVSGSTYDVASPGAYQTIFGGGYFDAFVAKFNAAGARMWSTYYGGGGQDQGKGIACDKNNNVYVMGFTASDSGIATAGAHQTVRSGTNNAFLARFDSTGNIAWGTYFGGNYNELGSALALNDSGYVFITGWTESDSGIATPGTNQTVYSGQTDTYLAKFNFSGVLQWGTYYGGDSSVWPIGLTYANSNLYMIGYTNALNDIATPCSYQTVSGGMWDVILAKFNATTSHLIAATFYGGSKREDGYAVAVDAAGTCYIAGDTYSSNQISTPGSHQPTFGGNMSDAFIAKLELSAGQVLSTINGASKLCVGATLALVDTSSGGVWTSNDTAVATVNSSGLVYGAAPGVVSINYSLSGGCSVPATQTLTVNPLPALPGITQVGDTLTSSPAQSYQWYNNGIAITGATNQQLIITQNGNYQVEVTDSNTCSNTSDTLHVISLGITATGAAKGVQLFPNPNTGTFTVQFADDNEYTLTLTDDVGKQVAPLKTALRNATYNLPNLPAGIYLLQVRDDEHSSILKVVIGR